MNGFKIIKLCRIFSKRYYCSIKKNLVIIILIKIDFIYFKFIKIHPILQKKDMEYKFVYYILSTIILNHLIHLLLLCN